MVRDVPFRAIQLTSYELLKNLLRTWRNKQQSLQAKRDDGDSSGKTATTDDENAEFSPADSAFLGGVAGAVSATITCPLDVIRTRLMVGAQKGVMETGGRAGAWAGAIREGGLFAGVGTRVFYVGLSSAIFFVVYESAKTQLFTKAATASSVKSERAVR